MMPGEKVTALVPIMDEQPGQNLFMATKKGIVKKTALTEFQNIRRKGLIAIVLQDDDELIEVKQTDENSEIFMITKKGMCIHFDETQVRRTGRSTMGVRGMDLSKDDEIVGMQIDSQGDSLLIVSEKGMGKRSTLSDFKKQHRGGKGLKCYKITPKTGDVMGVKAVTDEHEIMMITTAGIIIRIRMSEVKTIGRMTSGVKLIALEKDAHVVKIAKVRADEISDEEEETEDIAEEITADDAADAAAGTAAGELAETEADASVDAAAEVEVPEDTDEEGDEEDASEEDPEES